MRLGHGSLGRELWSGFFSVVGSLGSHRASVRPLTPPLPCVSTVIHMLLMSARIRLPRSLGGTRGGGRWKYRCVLFSGSGLRLDTDHGQ